MMKDLEIIIPVKNEAGNLTELVERIDAVLSTKKISYNLIFIDDRSTDNTLIVLDKLKRKYPLNYYIKKGRQGKAYSILEGVSYANSENLGMIDGDLQYSPEAIPQMFEKLNKYGVVIGRRQGYTKTKLRQITSSAFKLLFGKILFGFDHDIQSGLKLFKKSITPHLDKSQITPWTIDLPLVFTAIQLGYRVTEVNIDFVQRKKGQTKINLIQSSWELAVHAVKFRIFGKQIFKLEGTSDSMLKAGVIYERKKFITHTTLHHSFSALKTLLGWQKLAVFVILGTIFSGAFLNSLLTIQIIIGFLSVIYFSDVIFSFFLIIKSLRSPPEISFSSYKLNKLKEKDLPVYSILCPLYKEAVVLPQFLKSLSKLDWPKEKLDVQLLLEEDDKETIEAVKGINLPGYISLTYVPHSMPKTKPKACNYGLTQAKGEYLVVYDAEDDPDPDQLKKAYLAFSNASKEIVCLQAKLNYYNPKQNLLTRLFTAEYSLWFDMILPGLQSINTTIPLGGTSNHFKINTLKKIKGWDPFNVTEDCDLGIRLFAKGYKTAIIDSTTYEEANSKVSNWLRQRSRWIKGYMQTYLVHIRRPIQLIKQQGIHALLFHLIIGARISFLLINPIMWLMIVSYFAFYGLVGSTIQSFYLTPIFYIAASAFVFGNFLYLYSYMIGVAKRKQWELVKYIFLVPFYWLLASISAGIAFYQLIFKPHYWEKTIHGLHLPKVNPENINPYPEIKTVQADTETEITFLESVKKNLVKLYPAKWFFKED